MDIGEALLFHFKRMIIAAIYSLVLIGALYFLEDLSGWVIDSLKASPLSAVIILFIVQAFVKRDTF